MKRPVTYDPAERDRRKEASRAKDAADLESGIRSRREIAAGNGFLSPLEIISSRVICGDDFD